MPRLFLLCLIYVDNDSLQRQLETGSIATSDRWTSLSRTLCCYRLMILHLDITNYDKPNR